VTHDLQRDATFTWNGEHIECDSGIDWGVAEQSNGLVALLINAPGGILTGKQYRILGEIVGEDGLIKNSRRMAPLLRYSQIELMDAFYEVQSICDDCRIDEHDNLCITDKDQEASMQ